MHRRKSVTAAELISLGNTAGIAYILGFTQRFTSFWLPGNDIGPLAITIFLGAFLLPLLVSFFKKKLNLWAIFSIASAISLLIFLCGVSSALWVCILLTPSILVLNFQTLKMKQSEGDNLGWFKIGNHLTALLAAFFAWFVPYAGIMGYYSLVPCIIFLSLSALVPWIVTKYGGSEDKKSAPNLPSERMQGLTLRRRGAFVWSTLFLLFGTVASLFIFRIFGDFAWIDPNPIGFGVLRSITARPYAPFDAFLFGGTLLLAIFLTFHLIRTRPHLLVRAGVIGTIITIGAWLAIWNLPLTPPFLWSLIGLPAGVLGIICLNFAICLKLPRPKRPQVVWSLIVAGWFGGVVLVFLLNGVINRNMFLIDLLDETLGIILGLAIVCAIMVVRPSRGRKSSLNPPASFPSEQPQPAPLALTKTPLLAGFLMMLVIGGAYTGILLQYHGTTLDRPGIVYMWGIPSTGSHSEEWCEKMTHVTVGGFAWDPTPGLNGTVTLSIDAGNLTYYHARNIKVMPGLYSDGEKLWHLLNNTGGMQDRLVTSLRSQLVASSVDGVSVDFEMLTTPAGAPEATEAQWIALWERLSTEVFHTTTGSHYLFANYYGVGAGNARDFVNRYFATVDIHIQNCYESHWHLGDQGATTLADSVGSALLQVYYQLNDKIAMDKVVLGLPLYGYRWIWGVKRSIPQLPWYASEYTTTEERFEPYNVTMQFANNSIIRYDPFSGAEWFEYVDANGNRTVAYTQGAEQLTRILHNAQGYNIGGVMFWPGGNMPYPGLLDLL